MHTNNPLLPTSDGLNRRRFLKAALGTSILFGSAKLMRSWGKTEGPTLQPNRLTVEAALELMKKKAACGLLLVLPEDAAKSKTNCEQLVRILHWRNHGLAPILSEAVVFAGLQKN